MPTVFEFLRPWLEALALFAFAAIVLGATGALIGAAVLS